MKNLGHFAALAILVAFATIFSGMASSNNHPRAHVIDAVGIVVTLQNKCTRDVKYSLSGSGVDAEGTVAKGDKIKLTLAIGTAITVDGEDFMKVNAVDDGQTFQVCR